jgi:hypothetical protein
MGRDFVAEASQQTAGQRRLPIATPENPERGARRASTDRSVDRLVRAPQALVNVENVTPVTMEEVVSRPTTALVKVFTPRLSTCRESARRSATSRPSRSPTAEQSHGKAGCCRAHHQAGFAYAITVYQVGGCVGDDGQCGSWLLTRVPGTSTTAMPASVAIASRLSRDHATALQTDRAGTTLNVSPVEVCQSLTVRSWPALASVRPSGEKATAHT